MLEKIPYNPPEGPSHPEAVHFIPKFLYRDSSEDPPKVKISDEFYGTRRKLRIGVLGAGISGLDFLHHLFEAVPAESVEVVVYDKNEDVGGVVRVCGPMWLVTSSCLQLFLLRSGAPRAIPVPDATCLVRPINLRGGITSGTSTILPPARFRSI
jgi:hypothetical protein